MEFRVLGPVEVHVAGRRVDAGHVKQRSVLAVLLIELGRTVPVEVLIDRVWGDSPPASVRNNLYAYIARLKAALPGAAEHGVMLARRPGGYVLEADPDRVDLHRFRGLVAQAGRAADERAAAGLLRTALGLWRGPALTGMASPWLAAMRETLESQRIGSVLDLAEISLRLGEHVTVTGELSTEAAAHPGNERLAALLMVALYRSGRPGDALAWFERTRRYLAEELGADPGAGLRTVHGQILRADPALDGRGQGAAAGAAVSAPRELPADIAGFTGRSAELAELDRLLDTTTDVSGGNENGAAAVISAVSGTAGVGKTALAVHWAHRAALRFPDGQLYVNLRGYDPGPPVTAADALAGFLRALGVPGPDIPPGEAERAARYRTMTAGKRILVVLDNAGEADQVRPLLPGTARSAALITSRDALAGLVARDGAARLDLDLLPLPDAIGLLRTLIGPRVDADPAAVTQLARQCARLPLALRIAAELAIARPRTALTDLATELARQSPLALLNAHGDPRTAVRNVFSWSYRHLDATTARTFRMLGLHIGLTFDPYATAALTGSTLERADRALTALARAHLISPAGPHRYALHDLLRAYARELTADHDSDAERRVALTRLFDYYLHGAGSATDTLLPAEQHARPPTSQLETPAPPLAQPGAARTWLDANLADLAAMAAHTATHGWPSHTTRLSGTLSGYFGSHGRYPEAITVHTWALRAARDTSDRVAEAEALIDLAAIEGRQCRYEEATEHLRQATFLADETGDLRNQARALRVLGTIGWHQGHLERAAAQYQQALELLRRTGDKPGQARALGGLAIIYGSQGRSEPAIGHLRQVVALSRETGDHRTMAHALDNLGEMYARLERLSLAASYARQGLTLHRETSNRSGEAHALSFLGRLSLRQGRLPEAADYHTQALTVSREIGERDTEADALNGLGEICFAAGEHAQARTRHRDALDIAAQIGEKHEQARALNGLARACEAMSDTDLARRYWQQALSLYTELDAPAADEVRARLDQLS